MFISHSKKERVERKKERVERKKERKKESKERKKECEKERKISYLYPRNNRRRERKWRADIYYMV